MLNINSTTKLTIIGIITILLLGSVSATALGILSNYGIRNSGSIEFNQNSVVGHITPAMVGYNVAMQPERSLGVIAAGAAAVYYGGMMYDYAVLSYVTSKGLENVGPRLANWAIQIGNYHGTALGLSSGAMDTALSSEGRLQHGYKHASQLDLGFSGKWRTEGGSWINLQKEILSSPDKVFDTKLYDVAARGYYKNIGGKDIATFIFQEGESKGIYATTIKLSEQQMVNYGLN